MNDGTNVQLDVDENMHVDFGCGIGPKMQFIGNNKLVLLS